jgi:[ribosomal protein S5]-alanine N-acetyltransferase
MPTIPVLTTGRLVLRPFTLADAPAVARILSNTRMSEHTLRFQHPYPVETAADWIRQHNAWAEKGIHLQWAIVLPPDALVGTVSIALQEEPPLGDLGYWIDEASWNRGYATDATRAVIAWAFATLGLPRIEARCFASNAGSIRVLEKCGLSLEQRLPAHVVDEGQPHDVLVFSITAPDATRHPGAAAASRAR